MSSPDEIRTIALQQFAIAGYSATSLHQIAASAGISKAGVLYHYPSKEALLEAAILPAIVELEQIVGRVDGGALTSDARGRFIVEFVDFLLAHRLEVHLFINQGSSLEDLAVCDRANALVLRMATYFTSSVDSTLDRMRFGIALGGAAYTLVSATDMGLPPIPLDETRVALITILSELLDPVPVRDAALLP